MPTQRPRLLSLVLLASLVLACKRDTTTLPPPPEPGDAQPGDTQPGDTQPDDPADDRADPTTATEPGGRDTPVHDPVAQAFLDAHNHHRAERSTTLAQPLPSLAWSSALEEHAKQVASGCKFEHSSSDFGENLSARTDAAAPRDVVDAWVAEREHYDERKHACARGEVCGHYTQVMWRATTQVGCATRRCTQGSPFGEGEWSLSVCNYAPAGNVQGQVAY